jgi:glycosyl hydrolase family 99
MKYIYQLFSFFLLLSVITCFAQEDGEIHLKKYANGILGDKALQRAKTMQVKIPVSCREWHVWWGAPVGINPHIPYWQHWNNLNRYGKFDPQKTIEQLVPGTSWRRWINSAGYPLLGPYSPAQPDIIRWQLETAKNAGLESLQVHLWPSIWDEGQDMTPLPIFERILDTASSMNFPVTVHDEIQFRRPNVTKAQQLDSSIKRTVMLVKRYGKHPGWSKIDNMPVYYFQNWSKWLKIPDMKKYFAEVEKQAGPVYWVVEQDVYAEVYKIPQIKAVLCYNNSSFLHPPTYGNKPYPWDKFMKGVKRAKALARKYDKKFGILVYTRFDPTYARKATKGRGVISGEGGNFMLDSIEQGLKCKPDFIVITQWNDYQESAFIEPAWEFDGFNGDPYRYCRIIAAMTGKKFTPAKLPNREELDPYIRFKLFGNSLPGDMGPIAYHPVIDGEKLKLKWAKDSSPAKEVRLVQDELAIWEPKMKAYNSDQKLRLANWSDIGKHGDFKGKQELRFYVPGMIAKQSEMIWVGIKGFIPAGTKLEVYYRSPDQYFRIDSRWEMRIGNLKQGFSWKLTDNTKYYWFPLYNAKFIGAEGDILIRLGGTKETSYLQKIILWAPSLDGINNKPGDSIGLKNIDVNEPFVVVAYDKAGNAGQPLLISKELNSY